MEYLEGETLAARLGARAPLAVAEVITIAKQACSALGEAHRSGIVHRDVKPANIFITRRDGREIVKVLDFGIAKMTDPRASLESNLTSTSQILGTPRYMSPEQLGSTRSVGPPTDVWALGITIYESLTGKPAFETGSAFEVGARILSTELPRLSTVRQDVPASLEAVVERCLRKDPAERFANADELLAALDGGPLAPLAPLKQTAPLILPETRISDPRVGVRATRPMTPSVVPATQLLEVPRTKDTRSARVVVIGLVVLASIVAVVSIVALRARRVPASDPSPVLVASSPSSEPSSTSALAQVSAAPSQGVDLAPPVEEAPSASPPSRPSAAHRSSPPPRRTGAPAPRPTALTRPPDER